MFGTSTVTSKGQVTIPQDLRLMLDINPSETVYFEGDEKAQIIRVRKAQKNIVEELYGCLRSKKGYVDIKTVRDIAGKKLGEYYAKKAKQYQNS